MKTEDLFFKTVVSFLEPIKEYLEDEAYSEIMINGKDQIYVETKGKCVLTDSKFKDENALMAAVLNIAQYVGRTINDENPRLDARLPDGSRVHVVIPPAARNGVYISIRKFSKERLTIQKLMEFGSVTQEMADFLEACVYLAKNVMISGGTSSGKTSLLNVMSHFIPDDQRIILIEDSSELQLQQEHVVPCETRPPDKYGRGEVTMRDLIHSSLRMRPDRIILGEIRGGEALDLVLSMNSGHSGAMSTTHATSPLDCCYRLETLSLFSGLELPLRAIRSQVASAIHIVVQALRYGDGSRKISHITEILPLSEDAEYRFQDLFVYKVERKDEEGRIVGHHEPCGVLPTFWEEIQTRGIDIDESILGVDGKGGA